MRFLRIMMPVVLAAGALCAQDKNIPVPTISADPPPSYDAVIIPVKTLTGDSFDRLVKLLQVFQVRMQSDDKLRTIVVYAPRDVVDKMRKVVAELDTPGSEAAIGRNIEMTLTFLRASTKASATQSVLPADMEAVAKQLRASTQYKDIELWDTLPLHLQEGRDTTETLRLPGGVPPAGFGPATGSLMIHPEGVTRKDQGRYVRFTKLSIDFNMPTSTGPMRVGMQTSGDFMEGQKTVLGKVSGADDDTSIFVVISLKVLD
jgi:hypothetical protein